MLPSDFVIVLIYTLSPFYSHVFSYQTIRLCTHMHHSIQRRAGTGETTRHEQRLLVENTVLLLASLVVILTLRASRCLGRGSRQLPGISSQAPPPHPRPHTPHILPIVALSSHEPHLPVSSCIGSVVSHGICFTAFACIPIGPLLRTRRNGVMVMIPNNTGVHELQHTPSIACFHHMNPYRLRIFDPMAMKFCARMRGTTHDY